MASDRALASRALLLGTALSFSGVGTLVGTIGSIMGVDSFKDFRIKMDGFFIRNGIKQPENEEELE